MKKRQTLNIIILMIAILMLGINAQAAVKFEKKNLKLKVGNSYVLRLKGNNSGMDVSWKSSKPKVVSIVSSSYNRVVIKALKAGTSKVSAKIGAKKLICTVKVSKLTSFPKKLTMYVGDKFKYSFKQSAKWTLSNKNARVKVTGNKKSVTLTALKTGIVKLTATVGKKKSVCTITVIEKDGATLAELREEAKIAWARAKKAETDKTKVEENLKKSEASKTTAENKAKIAEEEKVKAEIAAKTATADKDAAEKRAVAAEAAQKAAEEKAKKDSGGSTDTIKIPIVSITLNKTDLVMDKGDFVVFDVSYIPSNATEKEISWKSSDTSVAFVRDGIVSAVGYGNTTITASSGEGIATCKVTVIRGGWLDGTELRFTNQGVLPIAIEDGEITSVRYTKYHAENENSPRGDYRYKVEITGRLASVALPSDSDYYMLVGSKLTSESGQAAIGTSFGIGSDKQLEDTSMTIDEDRNFVYSGSSIFPQDCDLFMLTEARLANVNE